MKETQITTNIRKKFMNNNLVEIKGEIVSYFDYDHSWKEEKFYKFTLAVNDIEGNVEFVPVSISERIIGSEKNMMGKRVKIIGKFNSYGKIVDGHNNKIFEVAALSIELIGSTESDFNQIYLDGEILIEPKYKITSTGKKMTTLRVSIENRYGNKNSFPVVVFGEAAEQLKSLKPKDNLSVTGKIQSRKYFKKDENGKVISKEYNYEILALEVAI